MPNIVSDIFEITENYPTSGALKVPGPNQASYTVYVYKFADWSVGNQSTLFAQAQSAVNPDGSWKGVFDSFEQVYTPVILPTVEIDGGEARPFTVVAISPSSTIVLGLTINAPTQHQVLGQLVFTEQTQSSEILVAGF